MVRLDQQIHLISEWSGAGSNRRHMDFQSIALPTELPNQPKGFRNVFRCLDFVNSTSMHLSWHPQPDNLMN